METLKIYSYTFTASADVRQLRVVMEKDLHRILRDVQTLVNAEQDVFEELKSLRLHLLTLLKHLRHVLHVLRIVLIDFLKRRLVLLLRLLHLLLRFLHPVLHLLHLPRETRKQSESSRGTFSLLTRRLEGKELLVPRDAVWKLPDPLIDKPDGTRVLRREKIAKQKRKKHTVCR